MAVEISSWIGRSLAAERYRVTAKLGEGGMGFVFQAWDRNLERDVVIKVPRRDVLDDAAFAGRFQREIRSLVRLTHPHIVKVLDVGESDGLPFAVLQYLSGGGLGSRFNAASISVVERITKLNEWLGQVAAALDFMHSQGYIHRDVKPDNILFDAHGNVFLSDFGIAKVLTESRSTAPQTMRTQTGLVLGTPQYMAPELIMGQAHDGRVDQYALAIVVYEMLSGVLPITGPTPAAILVEQTLKQPVPLEELLRDVPRVLGAAVQKALAKNPADRFPDCTAFARATLAAAGTLGGEAARLPTTQQAPRPFGTAAPPVAPPVARTAETTRVAQTYADWQTSPKQQSAGSPRKKVPTPVARPATASAEVRVSDERRRASRAERARHRKQVTYLVLAVSLGIVLVGGGASLVIILNNSSPDENVAARSAPGPTAASASKPATSEAAKVPDVQADAAPVEQWTNAAAGALEAGDFRVRITQVRPDGRRLMIRLQIENSTSKASVRLSPWDSDDGGGGPRLSDRRGTDFPWLRSAGQNVSGLVLEPGKPAPLLLYFELPQGDVDALRLELPAAAFGRSSRLGFDLPQDMLLFVTARYRKSKAVPGLREALAHADPDMRTAAARALGEIGVDAAVAVRELADRLSDDTATVRVAAAQALGEIGTAAKAARSALLRALGDAEPQVNSAAAKALKSLPPPSREDFADLRQALREPNPRVRAYALDALGPMGPEARRALPEILGALKDKDPALRTAAAGVLGTIPDDEAVNALAETLKDPEAAVRHSAVRSLAALRPAPGAVRALIAALDDADEATAQSAGDGLRTSRLLKEDVAALANLLSHGESSGRAHAASLLAAPGVDAKGVKSALISALQDRDKRVRKQAARALGNLKADAWDASKRLAALLADDDRDVRRSAIAALAQIGPDAAEAVPQLFRALGDDSLHDEASLALVKIGKRAVPGVVEKLSVKENGEKIEACRILGEIGPDASEAIEALSALAQDRKNQLPKVWKAAGDALKKIQR